MASLGRLTFCDDILPVQKPNECVAIYKVTKFAGELGYDPRIFRSKGGRVANYTTPH